MDQHKLRSLVFDKTGVRIDVDDPVFALVALNEAVLEEAVERHVARIDAASHELARLAGAAPAASPPVHGGHRAHDAAHDSPREPAAHGHAPHGAAHPPGYVPTPPAGAVRPISTQSPLITPRELRLLAAAAGIAILSALIVLGGQALFRTPAPALSADQAQALQRAERLEQALHNLDPKLRAQLPAELQK
ncbi:hypothetical protein FHW58_003253 [Duganella sp. 1224]|uniref:hypothetical protein n=1 Tax=Duganella sp. 1224 TaxID=2587052 RepID=UPI0015CAD345|nr:hypothetical protein [Duganella sp. 1224]NYE62046.1 hypothetical protein [Duganella sp. 1224]